MKARNFRYLKARSLDHAYRILQHGAGEALAVAGGQSLLAGLNMRLSAPKLLVDIGDLQELSGCSHTHDETRLGALTRHCELFQSELVRERLPLLRQAARHIGYVAIRNRGTLGGSLAYADPAAELPACVVALDATLVLGSLEGVREVRAETFFKGLFETDLRAGELILAVKFPVPRVKPSTGFAELARRHGDFALVGLAATAHIKGGEIHNARLVYFGCSDHAKVARSVSNAIAGVRIPLADSGIFEDAIGRDLQPYDTPGLRADTRIHLAKVLTRRVLNSLSQSSAA